MEREVQKIEKQEKTRTVKRSQMREPTKLCCPTVELDAVEGKDTNRSESKLLPKGMPPQITGFNLLAGD